MREYCLNGLFARRGLASCPDCVAVEEPGQRSAVPFPLRDAHVVLREAKLKLTPELIGQALVWWAAKRAGADVVTAACDPFRIRAAAKSLGAYCCVGLKCRRTNRWTRAEPAGLVSTTNFWRGCVPPRQLRVRRHVRICEHRFQFLEFVLVFRALIRPAMRLRNCPHCLVFPVRVYLVKPVNHLPGG